MVKIKPLGSRILVKRAEPQSSKGGILLPESSKEAPKQGQVIAIGPGSYDEEGRLKKMEVKVGDKVIFGSYAGHAITVKGMEDQGFMMMNEDEVLAVIVE